MKKQSFKIGTRGSPLALAQANQVKGVLKTHHPDLETEIVIIKTTGDWKPTDGETRLSTQQGGKGLFTKEIERALLDGEIDCAVHSMKDVESFMPDGLAIKAMLIREDARDAVLFRNGLGPCALNDLPQNAVVGTASVRRAAFAVAKRPDLKIEPLRGNVGTRIEKIRSGQVDISFLALAGLKRLGLESEAGLILSPEDMLPAAGQGAVGIQCREDDKATREILGTLNHQDTFLCVMAERAVLRILDGSCHTPIGCYAVIEGGEMHIKACIASLDGQAFYDDEMAASVQSIQGAQQAGEALGQNLKAQIPADLLTQTAKD